MKQLIHSLVVAGLVATAASAAMAQTDGMAEHGYMHHGDPAKIAQMHAQHLAELKAKLKITASQESAWGAFSDSMKPPANTVDKHPDGAELDKLTTPERIDKMRALHKERMAAMDAAMDKRSDATKKLYAELSPEQKKGFDEAFARMGRRMDMAHPMGHMPDKGGAKPMPPSKP